MIGVIDVEIQAANVSMPLYPVRAFVNSPSSIRLRNVPRKIGQWNITSVQIVAAYPDSSIKTANCVLVGGVWVGTIEGCPISGRSENGFTVFASGIDENGNPVSNYVLGKGLIEILEGDGTITPDAPSYYVHLYDEEPMTPKEGDMWHASTGDWYIYQNGNSYQLDQNASNTANQANQIASDAYEIATLAYGKTGDLEALVPAQASTQNQLADKAFVNSSIQTSTANFRGNWETWVSVPTNVNLYPEDYAGSKVPTVNDYLVVQDASGYVDPYPSAEPLEGTWRFKYSGTWATDGKEGWLPEYQVNETPMTAAQLAAINSNITSVKVALYDDALTKINYELCTIAPTSGQPIVLQSCFPITFKTWDEEQHTITSENASRISIVPDETEGFIYIVKDDVTSEDLFSTDSNGVFMDVWNVEELKFNNTYPTSNVTLVLGFPQWYEIQDRAINTISINASSGSTINLVFPTLIPNHARDFSIRVVASSGTYSTTPTLNVSGVTLMNAEGEMPEIATDENAAKTTLVYFSEIAPNIFLVKGEALEAIS